MNTNQHAVITGGSGRLGPIWRDEMEQMGITVHDFNLPDWDLRFGEDIKAYQGSLELVGIRPTILINNAAIDNPPGTDASFWGNLEEILLVNLVGAAKMSEEFIPGMIEEGGGVIVNIGSIMGNIGADWRNYPEGFEKPVAYNLSKAALVQMSRSITVQYGKDNIRCVTLAFGPFNAGLPDDFKRKFLKNVPLGRPVSEDSLRSALRFALTCPEAAGQQFLIDGGYTAW